MKRFLVLIFGAVVTAQGYNTVFGTRGTFSTFSARCEDMGTVSLNIYSQAFLEELTVRSWSGRVMRIDTVIYTHPLFSLSITPWHYFEISGYLNGYYFQDLGRVNTYGVWEGGGIIKGSYPLLKPPWRVAVGLLGLVSLTPSEPIYPEGDSLFFEKTQAIPFIPHSPGYVGWGLFDLGYGPVVWHYNIGYQSKIDYYFNKVSYLGIDMKVPQEAIIRVQSSLDLSPVKFISLIVEGEFDYGLESQEYQVWALPGIRFGLGPLAIGGGARFEVEDITNTLTALAGFSLSYDVIQPPKLPTLVRLYGRVTDAETGEPLLATLSFPESDISSITTDPKTGEYEITLNPGQYRIHTEAPGYLWKEKGVILRGAGDAVLDFELHRKRVFLIGKVLDKATHSPLKAKIIFVDKNATLSTDEEGSFRIHSEPGNYRIRAEAKGYIPEEKDVMVKESGGEVTFYLSKRELPVMRIYFERGRIEPKPESYPVLYRVAELLRENPEVRVEIKGHTDSVGKERINFEVSYRRAEWVRDWLMLHGIGPERMVVQGYGETMPIGDNRTISGRSVNRRVEIVIR